jgi:gas vesicle protein
MCTPARDNIGPPAETRYQSTRATTTVAGNRGGVMSDEKVQIEAAPHNGRAGKHSFAMGILAGTAVGVGVGMLVAPRAGAELRKQCKVHVNHFGNVASTQFHHAKETAGDWAHRSRHAYDKSREFLAHAAHETQCYVRDVADAMTMKARRAKESANRVTVIPTQIASDQPGSSRTAEPREAHHGFKAV